MKQRDHLDVRNTILKAAKALFVAQGYKKTTIRQIVEKSGILTGSIYHFFTSKEDIFQALISTLCRQCNYFISQRFSHESPAFRYAALCIVECKAVEMNDIIRETYYEAYTSPLIFEKSVEYLTEMTMEIFGPTISYDREDVFRRTMIIKSAMRSYVMHFSFRHSVETDKYEALFFFIALHLLGVFGEEIKQVQEGISRHIEDIRGIADTMIHTVQ